MPPLLHTVSRWPHPGPPSPPVPAYSPPVPGNRWQQAHLAISTCRRLTGGGFPPTNQPTNHPTSQPESQHRACPSLSSPPAHPLLLLLHPPPPPPLACCIQFWPARRTPLPARISRRRRCRRYRIVGVLEVVVQERPLQRQQPTTRPEAQPLVSSSSSSCPAVAPLAHVKTDDQDLSAASYADDAPPAPDRQNTAAPLQ